MVSRRLLVLIFAALFLLLLAAIIIVIAIPLGYFLPSQSSVSSPHPVPQSPPPAGSTPPPTTPPGNAVPPASCGNLRIYVMNVSQADAILIVTPSNRTLLIDSGSGMKARSAAHVISFLKGLGITRLDAVLATHYHEDHIGGMDDVLAGFDIGTIYSNGNCGNYSSKGAQRLLSYASAHPSTVVKADSDLAIDPCLGQARFLVAYDRPAGCWPSSSETSNENDNSVLLRIAYGNTSFLFAGDCEADCEAELLRQGAGLRSDVLKVGHHGSATSSTDQFLATVAPRYFIISVDRDRSVSDGYFHPRQDALSRIFNRGGDSAASLFRTDIEGDIEMDSNGSAIAFLPSAPAGDCPLFKGYSSASAASYGTIPAMAGRCG